MNIENLPLKILNKEKEESYRNKNHIKGLIHPTGGSCRLLPYLGIGPVSWPCVLSRKLLWGRAHKRGGTLPLLTAAEMVETLVYLHQSTVVGCLLANQVL